VLSEGRVLVSLYSRWACLPRVCPAGYRNVVLTPNKVEFQRLADKLGVAPDDPQALQRICSRRGAALPLPGSKRPGQRLVWAAPALYADPAALLLAQCSLGGPVVVRKGAADVVGDERQVVRCTEEGSPRRAGGQVSLVGPLVAFLVASPGLHAAICWTAASHPLLRRGTCYRAASLLLQRGRSGPAAPAGRSCMRAPARAARACRRCCSRLMLDASRRGAAWVQRAPCLLPCTAISVDAGPACIASPPNPGLQASIKARVCQAAALHGRHRPAD
jgi:hypothetical protein